MITFDEVYEQYATQVHRYCLVLLREPAAAEEVAERALVQAFAAFDRSQPSTEYVRLWLLRIARNVCRDYLREMSRMRRLIRTLTLNQKEVPDPEAVAITHMDVERLLAVLPRLQRRDRDLIALRCGAQLSYREVGELIGLSENSATVASHRAIRRLRELLEDPR
ncbi:MAG: sigma-70 family RNA polymerase sigma factor [Candidatus Dormiibacterota bacterium]